MFKKYRQMKRIIEILKKGLCVHTLDEIETALRNFYKIKGVDLDEKD